METDIKSLENMANILRKDVLRMIYLAGDGHPGPALSIADIVATLYFKEMNIDPSNPQWSGRDRLVLSKGHACPVVYAALARKDFFPIDELPGLRSLNSFLEGHPDMKKIPGIDMTSGSLGNGLSIGVGMALSSKIIGEDFYVYVIVGDGEIQEGIVWEAAMTAVHYNVRNLVLFIDCNSFQSSGKVKDISGLLPIFPKWQAFGWYCQEINGHNIEEIIDAINNAKNEENRPSMILARTIKGKGVPFMENDNSWHKRVPTKEELDKALISLGGAG